MSKLLEIMKNYDTEAKLEMLKIESLKPTGDKIKDLMRKARLSVVREKVMNQARIVLKGECPHERPVIGVEIHKVEPRDWIYWYEEGNVYGKCKFCGG